MINKKVSEKNTGRQKITAANVQKSGVYAKKPAVTSSIQRKSKKVESLKIGARNPFALAEAINKAPIDWGKYDNNWWVAKLRQTVGKPVRVKEKDPVWENLPSRLPYSKLFDPAYRSPIYYHGAIKVGDTGVYWTDEWGTDPNACKTLVPYQQELAYPYIAEINGAIMARVDAPIQGCPLDCWLVAAMSSIAWVHPATIGTLIDEQIALSNPNSSDATTQVVMDFTYPTRVIPCRGDPTKNYYYPAYAHSKYNETWPSVYEIYMAQWKAGNVIPNLEPGDPQWACSSIDTQTVYGWDNRIMFRNYGGSYADVSKTIWGLLSDVGFTSTATDALYEDAQSVSPALFGKTLHPTVAWTNCCGSKTISGTTCTNMNQAKTRPDPDPANPIIYEDAIIAANHAYSLLGVIGHENPADPGSGNFDPASPEYVVLRNPWAGKMGPDPNDNTRYLPVPKANNRDYTLAKPLMIRLYDGDNNNNSRNYLEPDPASAQYDKVLDGIFGLAMNDFVKYFAGYGWVI